MSTFFTAQDKLAINECCENGNLTKIKKMCKGFKYYNNVAMAVASRFGNRGIMNWLHANANTRGVEYYRNYEQAFRNSAQYYNTESCRWLLQADLGLKIDATFRPFINICESGDIDLVKMILIRQPSIDLDIMNIAFKCAYMKGHHEIADLLRHVNSDINVLGENNNLFLEYYNLGDLYRVQDLFSMQPIVITFNMIQQAFQRQHFAMGMWAYNNSVNIILSTHNDVIAKQLYLDQQYEALEWLLNLTPHANVLERYLWACNNGHLLFAKCIRSLNLDHDINCRNMILIRVAGTNKFMDLCNWLYGFLPFDNIIHSDDKLLSEACTISNIELVSWILDKRLANGEQLNLQTLFRSMCYNKNIDMLNVLYKYNNNVINCILDDKLYPKASMHAVKNMRHLEKVKRQPKPVIQEPVAKGWYSKVLGRMLYDDDLSPTIDAPSTNSPTPPGLVQKTYYGGKVVEPSSPTTWNSPTNVAKISPTNARNSPTSARNTVKRRNRPPSSSKGVNSDSWRSSFN